MNRKSRLSIYSCIYAVFYTFCLYRNLTGITFPFFAAGTLVFLALVTKEFSLTWKKDNAFPVIAVMLISISQPLTDKFFIHFFNVIFVFILLVYIALRQFAFDKNWGFWQTIWNWLCTFFGMFGKMFSCFKDLSDYKQKRAMETDTEGQSTKSGFPWKTVAISAAAALPLLIFVIAMLSSADAVFNNMWADVLKPLKPNKAWFGIFLLTVLIFFLAYGLINYLLRFSFSSEEKKYKKYSPVSAITVGIMLDIIYIMFSVIQILYLFIGNFALPEGYTYAEYAREGFFQLLFICVMNLVLVLIGNSLFNENKILKIVLTVTCICTYIMTASSAFRMILYIRYYYFTFLRLLVLWALAVVAVLLATLILHIWKKKFNLFKTASAICLVAYIILAFARLDYVAVKFNLENTGENRSEFFLVTTPYEDTNYIKYHTCADSASLILNNKEIAGCHWDYANCNDLNIEKYEKLGRKTNISRYLARKEYIEYLKNKKK